MLIATESLSRLEKLRLIEQFWEELSREAESIEAPDWHAQALTHAEQAVASGQAEFIDWDQAKERLRQGG